MVLVVVSAGVAHRRMRVVSSTVLSVGRVVALVEKRYSSLVVFSLGLGSSKASTLISSVCDSLAFKGIPMTLAGVFTNWT